MNILALGAHLDDIELGCGGTVAKHTQNGDKAIIYVPTDSGFTHYSGETARDSKTALEEGKKAAQILGATLITGHFKTRMLEFNDELNREIVKIIKENNIDIIYTHWQGDIHHDHRALALSSLHCGRHVKKILTYKSNWYCSHAEFKGNFFIDISDFWHTKEKALRAHVSEYKRVGDKWINYFRNEAQNCGYQAGVKMAERFEVIKWVQ